MAVMVDEDRSSSLSMVTPRWATPRTAERPSFGPVVARIAAELGQPFMPHQRAFWDVALEVQSEAAGDPDPGEWAYDDVTATWQRRAGKTTGIKPVATHRARRVPGAVMFMTAQKRETARRRFLEVGRELKRSPIGRDLKLLEGRMGEELRWLDGNARLMPFAPNDDDLHSETVDLVFVDEVRFFDAVLAEAVQEGYRPTLGTTGGQAIKLSTMGTDKSAWLNQLRDSGRAAVESGVRLGKLYNEHSLPDRVGSRSLRELSDVELVEACIAHHPAVCHVPDCRGAGGRRPCPHGFVLPARAIRADWSEMGSRPAFLRAWGNRSSEDLSRRWVALEEPVWRDSAEVDGIPQDAPVVLGVWVDEDGTDAAVGAGWRDPAGVMHTVHLERRDGLRWISEYVADLRSRNEVRAVAVGNVKAARDVADELEAAGIPVEAVAQADVSAACVRHRTGMADRSWRHGIRGGEGWQDRKAEAHAAASHAGWRLSRWDVLGESVAALGAQTMAGWGWDHAPKPPKTTKFKVR